MTKFALVVVESARSAAPREHMLFLRIVLFVGVPVTGTGRTSAPKTGSLPTGLRTPPTIEEIQVQVNNMEKGVNNMKKGVRYVVYDDYDEDDLEEDDDVDYSFGDDYYIDSDGKPLRIPFWVDQPEELRRLMKRKPSDVVIEDGMCCICGDDTHVWFKCPCNDRIPRGVVIDKTYDTACNGCGRIGHICSRSKGSYAVQKTCSACKENGHWFWEDMCDEKFQRPPRLVEVLAMKEVPSTEQSLNNSLQNKEQDEIMVDVGKDNKNEDEVMIPEDDGGMEVHEAKVAGGNTSSKQISIEKMENSILEGDSKNLINSTEHVIPANIYLIKHIHHDDKELRMQISQKLRIDEAHVR